MRKLRILIVVVTLALVPLVAAPTAASAACSTPWGSTRENNPTMTAAHLTNVRAGRHVCFDRLVIDLDGRPRPGFFVRYVREVTADGSGQPVPVRGGAALQVVVRASAHDDNGDPTYTPARRRNLVNVSDFRTFRQVRWAGDFEGQTTIGLGVRARLPFRVFTLRSPGGGSRMVVDVAHTW
jgi:hypothetical protein